MVQIIPAILATTKEQLQRDLERIQRSPSLQEGWLHLDFADGNFVQNTTIKATDLDDGFMGFYIEAHLMVSSPGEWINELKKVAVKRVIVHIEIINKPFEKIIEFCKSNKIEFGLAIKMDTPLEILDPYWDIIDLVLIMSIEPGFQGQTFISEALDRIEQVSKLREQKGVKFKIGVDGHVNDQNAKEIVSRGADNLVIGSFLLNGDIEENVEKIWEKINT